MPASRKELFDLLSDLGIKSTTTDHEAVYTVEESAKIKQDIPGGHTKNLFLKDKKGNFFLIVAEGSAQIKLNSVHGLIGASGRVSFGKPEAFPVAPKPRRKSRRTTKVAEQQTG